MITSKNNSSSGLTDRCLQLIFVPSRISLDEESTFFGKYCSDIAPLFTDMKNWKILFLYQGRSFACVTM